MSEIPQISTLADVDLLFSGTHHDPHSLLGSHEYGNSTVLRAYLPDAQNVVAIIGDAEYPYTSHPGGMWELILPYTNLGDYRLKITYPEAQITTADPYRFLPTLGDVDLYLFAEGRHERLWEILGSHVRTYHTLDGPVTGVSFALWAPHAKGVSVIGDFNFWNRTLHPMRKIGSSGIWELFIPDVTPGTVYKYCVRTCDGTLVDKADPLAQYAEIPPATGSVVFETHYHWTDDAWLEQRAQQNPVFGPMSVYEVHLGSWRQGLSYVELAEQLTQYILDTGFTHVEFLPVTEHPFGGSWGYQVTSYYAPTSRFGNPDQFRYLIDSLHNAGIGVIIDWVPAHFPKDSWALARFDGTALYEHADPKRGEQLDWGTYIFNFGDSQVRNFLVANALYWFDQFHIDGLRVDAVASMLYLDYSRPDGYWIPNKRGGRENLEAIEFLQEVNATVHKLFPGIVTIAEESTTWPGVTRPTNQGGLGFSMKWNMGWMHDTLSYFSRDPIHRGYHHHEVTFSLMYAWSENFLLPFSHDEVVHGKGTLWSRLPGDSATKAAGLRTLLAYQCAHPGKQLIFMGQEFGQTTEWNETRSIAWEQLEGFEGELHQGILSFVSDMNQIYLTHPALWELDISPDGYSWIEANDSYNNVTSFLRYTRGGEVIACIFNFSGIDHPSYRVGLPSGGVWQQLLNTDLPQYAGRGLHDTTTFTVKENRGWQGRPHSIDISLPAHSTIWLVPQL